MRMLGTSNPGPAKRQRLSGCLQDIHKLRVRFHRCSCNHSPKVPTSGQPRGITVDFHNVCALFKSLASKLFSAKLTISTIAQITQCVEAESRKLHGHLAGQWPLVAAKLVLFDVDKLRTTNEIAASEPQCTIIEEWVSRLRDEQRSRKRHPDADLSGLHRFGPPLPLVISRSSPRVLSSLRSCHPLLNSTLPCLIRIQPPAPTRMHPTCVKEASGLPSSLICACHPFSLVLLPVIPGPSLSLRFFCALL
jgi:hypothetical protein